jgi:hypothetical protein
MDREEIKGPETQKVRDFYKLVEKGTLQYPMPLHEIFNII